MAAETTAPKKVCVNCGDDVSGKPRTKDPEGKYYCAGCYGKLQAAAAKPPQAAAAKPANGVANGAPKVAMPQAVKPGDPLHPHSEGPIPIAPSDDVMSRLAAEAVAATSEQCPNCHRPWRKNSTLCTYCGFNSASGKQISTKVLRAEVTKEDKQYERGRAGGGGMFASGLLSSGTGVALVLGIPLAIGLILGVVEPALFAVSAIIIIALGVVVWIWTLVDAFQAGAVHGVCCLLVPIYSTVYVLFITESSRLKAAWLVNVVGFVGMIVLSQQLPDAAGSP